MNGWICCIMTMLNSVPGASRVQYGIVLINRLASYVAEKTDFLLKSVNTFRRFFLFSFVRLFCFGFYGFWLFPHGYFRLPNVLQYVLSILELSKNWPNIDPQTPYLLKRYFKNIRNVWLVSNIVFCCKFLKLFFSRTRTPVSPHFWGKSNMQNGKLDIGKVDNRSNIKKN